MEILFDEFIVRFCGECLRLTIRHFVVVWIYEK